MKVTSSFGIYILYIIRVIICYHLKKENLRILRFHVSNSSEIDALLSVPL